MPQTIPVERPNALILSFICTSNYLLKEKNFFLNLFFEAKFHNEGNHVRDLIIVEK
jgi:hypothetical protein